MVIVRTYSRISPCFLHHLWYFGSVALARFGCSICEHSKFLIRLIFTGNACRGYRRVVCVFVFFFLWYYRCWCYCRWCFCFHLLLYIHKTGLSFYVSLVCMRAVCMWFAERQCLLVCICACVCMRACVLVLCECVCQRSCLGTSLFV